MATVITIEQHEHLAAFGGAAGVVVHVTDATGRDETASFPRYPDHRGERYYRMVDALDAMMGQAELDRTTDQIGA